MNRLNLTICDLREAASMWLLDWLLAWLPKGSTLRTGIKRGIWDQCAYDRYTGYCAVCKVQPMAFESYMRMSDYQTNQLRPAKKCTVRDTSQIYVVRESDGIAVKVA